MKKITTLLLMLLLVFSMTACTQDATKEAAPEATQAETVETEAVSEESSQEASEESAEDLETVYPLTIVDSSDKEIVIEKKPEKVITLAPSLTEVIYAIGAEDTLKGRTNYCTYPPEVSEIASVGTLRSPSIETIAEISPDLIIASTHFKEETMTQLNDLGLTVVVLNPQDSFEGVYEVIEKTGLILDAQEEAQAVIADMQQRVNAVEAAVKDLEPTNVYYVVGFGEYGDYTAGAGTFIHHMIGMAGGDNAAADMEGWKYNLESLVEKDPYMLICSENNDAKAGIEAANGYMDLTAVKEGRLFEIDNNLLDRQGPRLAEGLEALAKLLHPEAFN